MPVSLRILLAALVAASLNHSALAIEETLQNDGFTSGSPVNFQAGFIAGEIAAARFEPQIPCPCVVNSITLLFGGSSVSRVMGISVWEDAAGANDPGTLLFTADVTLIGSNVNLQLIDLTLAPVIVEGPFRVGLEFGHNGLPSVATDLDGTIDASANFIRADIGVPFWFPSATLGVTGDFVIRATIDNFADPDTDGDGAPDSTDNCSLAPNPDQRDTNNDGFGNLCDADLNDDCAVNFPDLNLFKAVFFGNDPDADLNGDGSVNFADLTIVKAQFFGSPGPSGIATCD